LLNPGAVVVLEPQVLRSLFKVFAKIFKETPFFIFREQLIGEEPVEGLEASWVMPQGFFVELNCVDLILLGFIGTSEQ